MSTDETEDSGSIKLDILQAANKLGAQWYIERSLHKCPAELIFELGLLAISTLSKNSPAHRQPKMGKVIGRPPKARSELKPVKLYLQVHALQDFFKKTEGIALSHRQAIKLLIKYGEIPGNIELAHIEKQVSSGKRHIREMQKELLSKEEELAVRVRIETNRKNGDD